MPHFLMTLRTHLAALAVLLSVGATLAACQANPAVRNSRIGTNLAGVGSGSTSVPFNNVFKQARSGWISFVDGAGWTDDRDVTVDEHGWVSSLLPDQSVRKLVWWEIDPGAIPPGDFTVLYNGTGELRYTLDFATATPTSSSPGRDVLSVPEGSEYFAIEILSTDPSDYLRDIQVFLPGGICRNDTTFELLVYTRVADQADCSTGTTFRPFETTTGLSPFNPDYLRALRHYSVIRGMDMMATNNSPVVEWADTAKLTDATWSSDRGVPPQVLFELSFVLQADLWYNIPHQASDDYVTQLATLARTYLHPSHDIYLELSNEIWATNFFQHFYANEQGLMQGLYPDDDPTTANDDFFAGAHWLAKRSGELFDLYDATASKPAIRVLGTQAVNTFISRVILDFDPAVTQATHVLAIAPYFIDSDESLITEPIDDQIDAIAANDIPAIVGSIQAQADVAAEYGLELASYEGGQSLGRFFPSTPDNDARYEALNRHPRMFDLYDQYLMAWTDITCANDQPGTFLHYLDVQGYSQFGRFGAVEHLYQTPEQLAPKRDLLVDFSQRLTSCATNP